MRRVLALLILIVLHTTGVAVAVPRATGATVDAQGQVRITMAQGVDRLGGRAALSVDFENRLASLTSALVLPGEAGPAEAEAWVSLLPQAATALVRFSSVPAPPQVALELDDQYVEDEARVRGRTELALRCPLSVDRLPSHVAAFLARMACSGTGHLAWKHYTEADGNLSFQVKDPKPSDLKRLDATVTSGATTDLRIHLEVVRGSGAHRTLAARPQLQADIVAQLRRVGIACERVRVTEGRGAGGNAAADVALTIRGLRQSLIKGQVEALRRLRLAGVRPDDLAAALSTLLEVEVARATVVVKRETDHYAVDMVWQARRVDRAVLGCLGLNALLEPALVRTATGLEAVAALTAGAGRLRERRFQGTVAAAAGSNDAGDCELTFELALPRRQLDLKAELKHQADLTAGRAALAKAGVPLLHRTWRTVKASATPGGFEGHALYEAQGPWPEALWEAARGDASLQAAFPEKGMPTLQEGRLALKLAKGRLEGAGALRLADGGAWEKAAAAAALRPLALAARHDADAAPGTIAVDLYAKGDGKAGARAAVQSRFGARLATSDGAVEVPVVTVPAVDMPATLSALVEADRKLLAVTPWTPPAAAAEPPEQGRPATWALVTVVALAAAAMGVLVVRRRAAADGPGAMLPARAATLHSSPWDAADAATHGPPPRRLRVMEGLEEGRVIELTERDHDMGRGSAHTHVRGRIEFAEPTLSSLQALLKWEDGHFVLEHAQSATNPTRVNDRSIKRQVLKNGDLVRMGRLLLRYEAP